MGNEALHLSDQCPKKAFATPLKKVTELFPEVNSA
jgi:hypothetical protein